MCFGGWEGVCNQSFHSAYHKVLGIYTYTRKVTLDEFENKPRKTMVRNNFAIENDSDALWYCSQGYCTVSHFNVVHFECHSAAVK